ncbi:MAG: spore photoproduct lyase family protein [Parerythrobacter sp.]
MDPVPETIVPAARIPSAWMPKRVLITRSARNHAHGLAMAERAAKAGLAVEELSGEQVRLGLPDDPRRAYAQAKATLAIVVAPPSKRKLQPIAPSADWRLDLAQGCPAHCSYCYLAGSLKGPPITRAYANLDEIFDAATRYLGEGTITSRNVDRVGEGTTYEASCYTDPLGIEPITGSVAKAVEWFGAWAADAQLRFTTKFANVETLLPLAHNGRTRMRASVNPAAYRQFEAGTAPVADRLAALASMAHAGYPVGLTIAPIIAAEGWREVYGVLIAEAAAALNDVPGLDLTVELITHRFSPGSKATLESWYPGSRLDMSDRLRATKRTKFGSKKQVYDKDTMRELRTFFEERIGHHIPAARILYWT